MKKFLAHVAGFAVGIAIVVGAGLALSTLAPSSHSVSLSLKNPEQFVVQVDTLLDELGPVKADPALLDAWNAEILPWFAETDVAERPALVPSRWEYFQGDEANHILGYTTCADYAHINSRFVNPADAWYGDPEWVFVVAHELAHLQQGAAQCNEFSSVDIENSAQLAAAEVMSAIALTGNKVALASLLNELQYMALGYLRYEAWGNQEKTEHFNALLRKIWNDEPTKLAERNASYRYWAFDRFEQKGILYRYSYLPFKKMMQGEKTGEIPGLVLGGPATQGGIVVITSDTIALGKQTLYVDDLIQVLRRAPALLEDVK